MQSVRGAEPRVSGRGRERPAGHAGKLRSAASCVGAVSHQALVKDVAAGALASEGGAGALHDCPLGLLLCASKAAVILERRRIGPLTSIVVVSYITCINKRA